MLPFVLGAFEKQAGGEGDIIKPSDEELRKQKEYHDEELKKSGFAPEGTVTQPGQKPSMGVVSVKSTDDKEEMEKRKKEIEQAASNPSGNKTPTPKQLPKAMDWSQFYSP
jgi:hypothetical protein